MSPRIILAIIALIVFAVVFLALNGDTDPIRLLAFGGLLTAVAILVE